MSIAQREDRLDPFQASELMPAASLACLAALPARYMATFIWLARLNLPASVNTTPLGRYIRWQLSSGLIDLQGDFADRGRPDRSGCVVPR